MKVVIGRDVLFEGLQRVFSVVPQKPTLPVLTNFHLKTSSGRLFISGTDMDMSITTSLECTVEGEGAVTVNAKRFLDIIRELPERDDVTFKVENERVTVDFRHGCSSIMGMSSADFPSIRDSIEGVSVEMSGADFFEMVDKTSFAVAVERTRITLTGVYWRVSSEDMIMVATDGHRLSLLEKRIGIDTDKVIEAIIPPKALNQATRIFSGGTELKKVVFSQGMILFDFGATTVFSKLIEGPYHDFRQVIPTQNSKKVYVSTEELSAAVRRVSVLSNLLTHQIRFLLSAGQLEITTTNVDIGGEANESLVVRYEGDKLVTGFNASFLLEILRKIDTDEVLIELETSTSACIFKPVGQEEKGEHIYLIMPLRLSDQQ